MIGRLVITLSVAAASSALFVLPAPASSAQVSGRRTTTWLSIVSQPGDPLGRGQSWGATSRNRILFGGNQGDIRFVAFANNTSYSVELAAPAGGQLTTGEWTDAQRARYNGTHPGVAVEGDGRACNTDSGHFLIRSLITDTDGSIVELDASFTQYCDNAKVPLHGTVRYKAPNPRSVLLTSLHPITVRDQPTTLTALTAAGATVSFYNGSKKLAAVTADRHGLARLTTTTLGVGVHTLVARAGGHSSQTVQDVHSRRNSLWYRSDGGDLVGRGGTGTFARPWASLSFLGSRSRVYFDAESETGGYWQLAVEAPTGTVLKPGRTYQADSSSATAQSAAIMFEGGGDACDYQEHGSFEILSIETDPQGKVTDVAVEFTDYCGTYATRGIVRYAPK